MAGRASRFGEGLVAAQGSKPVGIRRTSRTKIVDVDEEITWQSISLDASKLVPPDETEEWELVEKSDVEADTGKDWSLISVLFIFAVVVFFSFFVLGDRDYYENNVAEKQIEDEWTMVNHKPASQRGWQKATVSGKRTAAATTTATTTRDSAPAQRGIALAKSFLPRRTSVQSHNPSKGRTADPGDGGYDGDVEAVAPDRLSGRLSRGRGVAAGPVPRRTGVQACHPPAAVPTAPQTTAAKPKGCYVSFRSLGVAAPKSFGNAGDSW
ncbi:hypothetical protein F5Y05DRAFT_178054 [Hypoxylon sp. FL0543]|nr:hypothetical protein F5Y05DRAFT_178054 [Hypoxylon sp. FL0543]